MFHHNDNIRRDELARVLSGAARLNDYIPPGQQTFVDVPSSNPLWTFVERIADHAADFGARPCPGGQCFFPSHNATRAELAQMLFALSNGNSNGMFIHGNPFYDSNNYDYPADSGFHTSDPINGQPTGQADAMYIGGNPPTIQTEAINIVWNSQEIQWIGDHEQYGQSVRYGPAFALIGLEGWTSNTGNCSPVIWDTSYPNADTNLPGTFEINTKLYCDRGTLSGVVFAPNSHVDLHALSTSVRYFVRTRFQVLATATQKKATVTNYWQNITNPDDLRNTPPVWQDYMSKFCYNDGGTVFWCPDLF